MMDATLRPPACRQSASACAGDEAMAAMCASFGMTASPGSALVECSVMTFRHPRVYDHAAIDSVS